MPKALTHALPHMKVNLPALTSEQVRAITEVTEASLHRLLTEHSLSANTMRAYRSALRYWHLWHVATYDAPLPLVETPIQPVPGKTVQDFIAQHAPIRQKGSLQMAMPPEVVRRMDALSAFGIRRVSTRAAGIDPRVPSLATIRQRVFSLNALHATMGVTPAPLSVDPQIRLLLRSLLNAAQAPVTETILRKPKKPILRELFEAMMEACERDGLQGVRDAALLGVAFFGGGRRRDEIASMTLPNLSPSSFDGVPSLRWTVMRAKGLKATTVGEGVDQVHLVGPVFDALLTWQKALLAAGKPVDGPLWYRLRPLKGGGWSFRGAMDAEDIAARIKARVAEQGEDPDEYGAHSLRSGAATTALNEGVPVEDVARMLNHSSIRTTATYYDRRVRSGSAGAVALALGNRRP